jgi:hypothetical protein
MHLGTYALMSLWALYLCPLPSDPACQLDVLGHDGDSLGVDGAQVGVLKQTHCLYSV